MKDSIFARLLNSLQRKRGFRFPMELSVKAGDYELMALIAGDGTGSQFEKGQAAAQVVSAFKVSVADVNNKQVEFELTPEELVNA
jgi:acetolactate synthase small subunit